MKTIYINGKFFSQPITGVQRYAQEILWQLDKLINETSFDIQHQFVLIVPSKNLRPIPYYRNIKVIQSKFNITSFLWEQFWLPYLSKNHILINLSGSAPMFKFNQFCTFHDAAVFENSLSYKKAFVWWYRMLFKFQSVRCLKVFTVSNFSKKRLSFFLKMDTSRISVMPNSSDHMRVVNADTSILRRLSIFDKKYFFAIASANPSKNINKLIDAFQLLNCDQDIFLVLAGGTGSVFSKQSESRIGCGRVLSTGVITDCELKALYTSAIALVFPSTYEGFGIPPLEAMACGCPVIASNLPVINEVCSDAALYFDPNSIDSMICSFNKVLLDPFLLSELVDCGISRSSEFSWKNSAKILLDQILDHK